MPAVVRQSRTGLPKPRKEMSFTWSARVIKQLLRLIKDSPESRLAFFPVGIIKRFTKSGQARGLLLELVKHEPDYLEWLRLEGWIKKDEQGQWIPRTAWLSNSFSNPVITQMASLNTKYTKLRAEYKIEKEWNKFEDLPRHIRADFKMSYPWFFQYKELAHPSQEFERPPVTSSQNRIDRMREAATPAPAPPVARPIARPRQSLPPSPSPSDRSSSSSSSSAFSSSTIPSRSPSPSASPSPPPLPSPSPPPVASLLRMSLTPRPNLAPQQSSNNTVVTAGPRPHTRPNAIASSSRIPIPIKVEPTSSSSTSASPASDIHMWGQSDSDSTGGSDSEHEMENDVVKSEPRSVAPPRHGRDLEGTMAGKRYRPDERSALEERPSKRGRAAIAVRSEPNETAGMRPTSTNQALPLPDHDDISASPPSIDSASAPRQSSSSILPPSSDAPGDSEEGERNEIDDDDDLPKPDYEGETQQAKTDRLMSGLRAATGPENLDLALETIQLHHNRVRRDFEQAITDCDKLEIIRSYREYIFGISIDQLCKHHLLPRCLTDCRLLVDSFKSKRRVWVKNAAKAGATRATNEEALTQGSNALTRIHVRSDLSGLDVQPDIYLTTGGPKRRRYAVRQYSFMAFARFYYNRICRHYKNYYLPLPAPTSTRLASIVSNHDLASRGRVSDKPLPATMPAVDGLQDGANTALDGARTISNEDDERPEPGRQLDLQLMSRLHTSVTPLQTPTMKPDGIISEGEWLRYTEAVDQHVRNRIMWLAQLRTAVNVLSTLGANCLLLDCLTDCRVRVGIFHQDRDLGTKMREVVRAAGATLCFSNDGLDAGDPRMTRCQVNNNSGFAIGSLKFVAQKPEGCDKGTRHKVGIRHYSFLAFFRFFYERLLEKQSTS